MFHPMISFIGFFPSPLAPHNELQKFQSTEEHLPKPPLTNHFLHALCYFQTSVFDYTKSLWSFVEIWIMPHTPSELSRRPKNWEAQPMPEGGQALSVAPQAFWYSFLLGFTASLNKPLSFYERETLPFLSYGKTLSLPQSFHFYFKNFAILLGLTTGNLLYSS